MRGIRCPSISWDRGRAILSCPDAIAGVLERHYNVGGLEIRPKADFEHDPKVNIEVEADARNLAGQCPECGGLLVYQEGCLLCPACGYTKC